MTRHRRLRVATVNLFSLLLMGGLLAGPAAAKNPDQNLTGSATATPGTASAGGQVRIDVSFTNISSSNFATFDVQSDPGNPGPITNVFAATVTYPDGSTDTSTPSCTIDSGNLSCSFGALNSMAEASFWVIADVPDPASGSLSWDFEAYSTGSTTNDTPHGGPGQSHGDVYTVTAQVNIATGDQGGTYIYGSVLSSEDYQTLGKHNPQAARQEFASYGENGWPATESEVDGTTYECPTDVADACFGQWFLISANYGAEVPGGITLYLSYYKISGNPDNVSFVHLTQPNDEGGYDDSETIPSYNDNACFTGPDELTTGCIADVQAFQGGATFTLLVSNNGPYRAI